MEAIAKLAVGPMSGDIIEAVYSYSEMHEVPLMLIASKNQVDYDKGYVFKTADYRSYLNQLQARYPKAQIYVCRDHCGPGHNSIFDLTDTYRTLHTDIEHGFDMIHVDFCFHTGGHEEILKESKRAVEYILKAAPKMLLEIGTDENTGANVENATRAEEIMKYFTSFSSPHFFVLQTGSVVREDRQEGVFHDDYVKKLYRLAEQHNVALKEHNADYLSATEIRKRQGIIGAVNIAPQLGLLQTQLTLYKAKLYGIDPSEFIDVSYRSRKWEKWLHQNDEHNKLLCSTIAGHYNFNSDAYQRLYHQIMQYENFNVTIQEEMHRIFDLYITNLQKNIVPVSTRDRLVHAVT